MKTTLIKSETRGHNNLGWLDSKHTFSFSHYFDPTRMGFGKLRVINDDTVAPGMGFGKHPHSDMEIISIPLKGDLEHKDSMGNVTMIHEGDIQVMSAGSGVTHSEYNKNKDKEVEFFQIWVIPNKNGVEPRYDQQSIEGLKKEGEFYQILSPNSEDEGVWIHQNAWFHLGDLKSDETFGYELKDKSNGVYVMVLEGEVSIGDTKLERRDGLGIEAAENFEVKASADAKVLLMEIPMN